MKPGLALLALVTLLCPAVVIAGPPYLTDDPEPVEAKHFEIYLASVVETSFQKRGIPIVASA